MEDVQRFKVEQSEQKIVVKLKLSNKNGLSPYRTPRNADIGNINSGEFANQNNNQTIEIHGENKNYGNFSRHTKKQIQGKIKNDVNFSNLVDNLKRANNLKNNLETNNIKEEIFEV